MEVVAFRAHDEPHIEAMIGGVSHRLSAREWQLVIDKLKPLLPPETKQQRIIRKLRLGEMGVLETLAFLALAMILISLGSHYVKMIWLDMSQ